MFIAWTMLHGVVAWRDEMRVDTIVHTNPVAALLQRRNARIAVIYSVCDASPRRFFRQSGTAHSSAGRISHYDGCTLAKSPSFMSEKFIPAKVEIVHSRGPRALYQ